jgi:integrase/recombinase XerD
MGSQNNLRLTGILQAFDKWGFDVNGWAVNTRRLYVSQARQANDWIKEHRGHSILRATADDLQAYLFSRPPVATTRNNYRQALVALGRFMKDTGRWQDNRARFLPTVKTPKLLPKALDRSLAAQIEQASRAFSVDVEAMVKLFLFTGVRKSEAQHLRWADIDFDAGWIRILGKGAKERTLPIHKTLREALIRQRMRCPDPEWVFPGRFPGRPISNTWIFERLHEVGQVVGISLRPHLLRHTLATELYEISDVLTTQTALGHASPETTAIYAMVRPRRLERAMSSVDYSKPSEDEEASADQPKM